VGGLHVVKCCKICTVDCYNEKINKNVMGETCSLHEAKEKYIGGFGWKNVEGRNHTRKT
jgi:hypothetical protein